jgi:sugar fermentation stimulation protein A
MHFPDPLMEARLIRRYKRFLADIRWPDGSVETVHCPNPGAMLGLDAPESRVFVSRSANAKRKYPLTLEIVEADGTLVGINTGLPNRLAEEAITSGAIPELAGYDTLRREVRYGVNSRIDILLEHPDRPVCYVEVKNVHLRRQPEMVEFPDCVTARGAKHLQELGDQVEAGHRALMLFIVQRADGKRFDLAHDIDPAYAAAFARARERGVEALAYSCTVSVSEILVTMPVPIDAWTLQPALASTR